MTMACEELMVDGLGLFIPSPNHSSGYGPHQDAMIPNPGASSNDALSRFKFVGQLIGVAARQGICLPLRFPSIVWRKIVHEAAGVADVEAFDQGCVDHVLAVLSKVSGATRKGKACLSSTHDSLAFLPVVFPFPLCATQTTAESTRARSASPMFGGEAIGAPPDWGRSDVFSVLLSDGRTEVDLIPHGRSIPVTPDRGASRWSVLMPRVPVLVMDACCCLVRDFHTAGTVSRVFHLFQQPMSGPRWCFRLDCLKVRHRLRLWLPAWPRLCRLICFAFSLGKSWS